ncbi:MAG: Rieske 2Fe-2S domain-containing protein [Azonexus sp.]|nr:Rieske 2Fe-2S domain-containing protein [Azonexus sp.]
MAAGSRLICTSPEVTDAGLGFRFEIERFGRTIPSFVIRYNGQVYAYLNECGHVPAELDWLPGQFFDDSKLYLICSIHGALYAPESGRCLGGRCQGKGLKPLKVQEIDGQIFLEQENNYG